MKIYNYHPVTNEYLGESSAVESPLEAGVYLIPACATEIQPPVAASNEVAVFENGSWQLKADFRNKKFWKKATKESVEITEIGVIPDETLTDLEPAKFEKWGENGWEFDQEAALAEIRLKRNVLLAGSDWTQLPDSPLDSEKKAEWQRYRTALRNLPAVCDPENPVFPVQPE